MLVLKHLHDWSFEECEREVRGSLVYRAFCRIDGERVPDAKTLIRLAHLLDEPVLKDLLAQLVVRGRERRVIKGRRLRVDTTVVETNIHYPTDATLLGDGIRVLTRTLRQLGEQVRTRTRAIGRRVFEIAQRSRTAGPQVSPKVRARSKAQMKQRYQELMGITRAVLRQAEGALARQPAATAPLGTTIDLVQRVVAQTRARVLRGDTRFPGKVVSLFEPHTEIIRKGKLAKPTEFGRVVKIQEAEAQFITDYEVCERGQAERASGPRAWIATSRSSITLHTWRWPTAASPRGAMSARRRTAASGMSCCRARLESRARARRARRCAGAQAAKDASAH